MLLIKLHWKYVKIRYIKDKYGGICLLKSFLASPLGKGVVWVSERVVEDLYCFALTKQNNDKNYKSLNQFSLSKIL